MVDRAAEISPAAERVVDDERDTMLVRYVRNGSDVRYIQARIADGLDVKGFRLLVDEFPEILRGVAIREFYLDAQAWQCDLELIVGAAIEETAGDDVLSGLGKRADGDELGSLSGRGCQRRRASFECRHPLFEHTVCRVHDARVDVPKFLEGEKVRGVAGIVKGVGRGLVDWHRPCIGRRIRLLSCVQLQGLEAIFPLFAVVLHTVL